MSPGEIPSPTHSLWRISCPPRVSHQWSPGGIQPRPVQQDPSPGSPRPHCLLAHWQMEHPLIKAQLGQSTTCLGDLTVTTTAMRLWLWNKALWNFSSCVHDVYTQCTWYIHDVHMTGGDIQRALCHVYIMYILYIYYYWWETIKEVMIFKDFVGVNSRILNKEASTWSLKEGNST